QGPIIIRKGGLSANELGRDIRPARNFASAAEVVDVDGEAGAYINESEAGFPGPQTDTADVGHAGLDDHLRLVGVKREGDDLAAADRGFAPAAQADSAGGEVGHFAQ